MVILLIMKKREQITKLRKRRKMSLQDLADLVDSNRGYIWQIESGRRNPSIEFLEKMANALGVKTGMLL